MRILGRISYAFLMAVLLLFVISYTQAIREDLYFNEKIEDALADEDYLFFYSSVPDYNQIDAVYSSRTDDLNVEIYALAVIESQSPLVIKERLYVLMHHKNEDFPADVKLKFINDGVETIYQMSYYRTFMNVMVGVNASGEVYLPFIEFDEIKISNQDNVIFNEAIDSTTLDIHLEDDIRDFYDTNGKLPTDRDLVDVRIMPINEHILSGSQHVLWIGVAIYVVILVLTTYFIFFFKPKKLGKEPLTQGLQKDVESISKDQSSQ